MGINYLSTTYLENLVSPSYKKREFSRTVSEALPEGTTKEQFEERAEIQQSIVESLVQGDIKRTIEEFNKPEEKE
jgi:hypothetical protein